MSGKLKLFVENFLIYGFGNIISSIIPFLMLPVITRLLKDSYYYGINDIFNVIVTFGSSIAMMGMYDAMFRMFFERESQEYKRTVCSGALVCVLTSGLAICSVLILFRGYFAELFFNSTDFTLLVAMCSVAICSRSLLSIVSAPTRMQNKREVFVIVNTISPLIGYAISIPMLLSGKFLLALPLAHMISSIITLFIFTALNYKWFNIGRIDFDSIKQLIRIGLPLVPTFFFYWVFSSFDRIMISKMLGTDYAGIYGVGAKVAGISQFIYLAFSGGWGYFTFSTMKDEDHIKTVSNVFEYLGVISFAAAVFVIPFSKVVFGLLFSGDYVYGSIVFPYLFLSPLITLLYQVAGSQFVVIKNTLPGSLILLSGVVINITLAYLLIPLLGIEGAALGVLAGYSAAALGTTVLAVKKGLLKISRRFLICILVTYTYIGAYRILLQDLCLFSLVIGLGIILCFTVLFKNDLHALIMRIKIK